MFLTKALKTLALAGFVIFCFPTPQGSAAPEGQRARDLASRATVYYDVVWSKRQGLQTTYFFSEVHGAVSTLSEPGKDLRRGHPLHFLLSSAVSGLSSTGPDGLVRRPGHNKVPPGYYYWQQFSAITGNVTNTYRLASAKHRIRLEPGKRYYLGEFRIVADVTGGDVAFWVPGNIEQAEISCEKITTLKTTHQKPKEPCNLLPALMSDEPITTKFFPNFRRY